MEALFVVVGSQHIVFLGDFILAVLGLRLLILGVLLDSPLHIWIVPQTALGSGLVTIIKLTRSARSSVESTVRSLDLTADSVVKYVNRSLPYEPPPHSRTAQLDLVG